MIFEYECPLCENTDLELKCVSDGVESYRCFKCGHDFQYELLSTRDENEMQSCCVRQV